MFWTQRELTFVEKEDNVNSRRKNVKPLSQESCHDERKSEALRKGSVVGMRSH